MTPGPNNIFADFRRLVIAALDELAAQGALPSGLDFGRVAVEPPRDPAHGDLATNAAMVLAGPAKQNPMALAERIAAALSGRELESAGYNGSGFTVTAARPGFLNVRLDPAVWHAQLRAILLAGTAYGDTDLGRGEPVNVEFVSANPTGPMHVGHGRGAVVGDALAALLAKAGFAVHREYYINDAGAQVDVLARSTVSALPRGARRDGRADPGGVLSRRIPRSRPGARSPNATATNGSAAPRPSGSGRCATSRSPRCCG